MTDTRFDLIVVGGGMLGMAHAYHARKRGWRVTLFERNAAPVGASIRNFGMVWPIGQPIGAGLDRALRTREFWLQAAAEAGFWHEPLGSLHAAHHEDELAVLEEFVASAGDAGYRVRMLTPAEATKMSPGLVTKGLLGAMFSATEVCVDSRFAIQALWNHLSVIGVEVHARTPVVAVESPQVVLSDGRRVRGERIVVCSGEDLRTLFPNEYARSGLVPCKLQMMRTVAQPDSWRMGPMLAAGATLRHYAAFKRCPSLARVSARFSAERPEFDRCGIHVMVSQTRAGELTIGDTHEYDDNISPFNRDDLDRLMLDYLATFFAGPDMRIGERWQGVYAKNMHGGTEFVHSPQPGVLLVNGPGGAGMTLGFGLAHDVLEQWEERSSPRVEVATPRAVRASAYSI